MRFKESLIVGLSRLAKIFIAVYATFFILDNNYQIWEWLLSHINIHFIKEGFWSKLVALALTIISTFAIGRFSISRFASPKVRKKANNLLLVMRGGYKKVWFEGYGPGTSREKVGIVLGKSVVTRPDGSITRRVVVSRARFPLMPEPVPLDQAPIIHNKFNPWIYELLGINFPENLQLEKWSLDLFENIPEQEASTEEDIQT